MDISSLTQNLMKGLAQKNNAELTALSRVLDVALGKVTMAQVTETTPVTPQERQALLNKTTEALMQLNKLASTSQLTPAAKEEISRLLEQQTIIKSPDLKWATLVVNNRQLLTYTDKPLVAGQTVPVQLSMSQKLVLLDLPETTTANNSATTSASATTSTSTSIEQKNISSEKPNTNIDNKILTKNPTTLTTTTSTAKVEIATVTETAPITEEERQELLKKTTEELLQLNKVVRATKQSIPGLKEAILSLQQQQAVIKSPNAKWIHITVNNQSLLTYTDKPLIAGQKIPVQVITPQKIVLLDLPELENLGNTETDANRIKVLTETINAALTVQKNTTPTYFAKLALTTAQAEQKNIPVETTEKNIENPIATKNTTASTTTTPPPKIQIATVTETAPITLKERQELLNKTTEELAQLNKAASATTQPIPGLKDAIAALQQQQAVIKSPDAKWIHILVNNEALLTYTDKTLIAGQKVPVQIVSPQKIALLDLPELNNPELADSPENKTLESKIKVLTETINSALTAQKNSTPTYFAKLALPTVLSEQDNGDAVIPEDNLEHAIPVKNTTTLTVTTPAAKIQIATVTETAPITPKERQELLNKTSEELMQLNKMARVTAQPIPGLKEAISSLQQQQAVIKSPDAKWIHITVNNQTLLTYTDKPLITGQKVPVQVVSPQKIVLLDLPKSDIPETSNTTEASDNVEKNSKSQNNTEQKIKTFIENINSGAVTQKNSTPTYFAKLALPTEPVKLQVAANQTIVKDDAIESTRKTEIVQKTTTTTPTITPATTPTTKTNPITTNISTTNVQIATVIKSTPVTPQDRQELLQKTTEELAQINKLSSNSAQSIPSAKEVITLLLEQQALIKSPNLKSLQLSVNNQSITTYTDKPVVAGQTIPVQVISAQKLVILDTEEVNQANSKTNAVTTHKNSAQPDQPDKSSPPIDADELEQTFVASFPVENLWKNIPSSTQQILTPTTLEQALKSVAERIRLQLELTQTKTATSNTINSDNEIKNQATTKQPISAPEKVPNVASASTTAQTSQNAAQKQLNEVTQVLNGTNKQLSTELTAKLFQQLIASGVEKTQSSNIKETTNQTTDQTEKPQPAKNQTTNQIVINTNTTTATSKNQNDQVQDIEKIIQQLLTKPNTDMSNKEARAQLVQLMQLPTETFEKMDISKLTQHLAQGLEQKNNAEMAALSRALNVAIGKVAMANVTETAPVTPQERQELLNKTTDALAQLNKLASNPAQATPALKAEISQLQDQQALIKSPDLKWVNLLVNNRPVLTYTDKPISVGQALPVQLVTAQKLVLLELPQTNSTSDTTKVTLTNNSTTSSPTTGEANNTSPTYSAKSITQTVLNELQNTLGEIATKNTSKEASIPTAATSSSSSTTKIAPETLLYKSQVEKNTTTDVNAQQIKKIIADNLRQLLPHKDTPNVLFSAVQQWQKIPAANQQRLVPATIEQALKSLAEQIRSPLQLTQPKELAQIIKDSGVFFENKLNAVHAEITADNKNTQTIAHTFSHDLKGSLLTLLSKVNQELNGSNKPLTTDQTAKLLHQLSGYIPTAPTANTSASTSEPNKINAQDIQLFMQELMNKPVKELSNKELRTQLLILMQQHSIHGLAKIQLQQLASLNHELNTKDSSQPSASWQVDIPVKHHNDIQHVHVRIDRDWAEEKHSSPEENKTSTKVKQWSVTLRFDLPTLGEFCAQLAIVDTTVSATLWATQEKTFAHVRDKMNTLRKNLEKEGIEVKQLQCMKGMPPEKPMALSYSLIDIST